MSTRTRTAPRPGKPKPQQATKLPRLEVYTDERVAEFLLSNTVDAADYVRAVKLVRKMGLDPAKIDHDKPIGVA